MFTYAITSPNVYLLIELEVVVNDTHQGILSHESHFQFYIEEIHFNKLEFLFFASRTQV